MSAAHSRSPVLVVVMGVSGCGKSTVGQALAEHNGWSFLEGDTYHPPANIDKMSRGTALTDADRAAWIGALCETVKARDDDAIVLACSALTPFVRSGLKQAGRTIHYIHLSTERVDMAARLTARDHFMPADLLPSQYAALSVPDDAPQFDAGTPVPGLVDSISAHLHIELTE